MKCLCFSDSHGDKNSMYAAILRHPDAEVVFFLGDGLSDAESLAMGDEKRMWIAVRGNCDFYSEFSGNTAKRVEEITLNGKKIVLTHGDLYGVKSSLAELKALARERSADIVLFGHTHIPCEEYVSVDDRAVWLFNPGSVGTVYGRGATYGTVIINEKGEIKPEHYSFK